MPINKSGLGLLNFVTSKNKKYPSLKRVSTELIRYVTGEGAFSNGNHLLEIREERRDRQKKQDDANDYKLKVLVRGLDVIDRQLILRAKRIGAWMNVRGNKVTGTVFMAT